MHRPLSFLSTSTLVRFIFTALVLFPVQDTLVAASHPADPDRTTLTLTAALSAQDVKPFEPFRGIDRG